MAVLVTGANGFLGKRLCRMLEEEGREVRALLRKEGQFAQFEGTGIRPIKGNLQDMESLERAMEGVSEVHHLAALASDWAPDPSAFYKVNFQGTLNVLDAAQKAGVRRTVVASTAATIGPPAQDDIRPVDENQVREVRFFTEYAASKILAEERIQHRVRAGEDIVITNPTRIFGPGIYDRKNGLIMLMDHFLHRPFALMPGTGEVIGNYVYVDDVAQGHILAMEKGQPGEKYLLGGHDLTFKQYFEALERITQQQGSIVRVSEGILKLMALAGRLGAKWFGKAPLVTREYLEKLQYDWPVSSAKAEGELGYVISDLDHSLRAMWEWLLEYRKSSSAKK